MSSSPSCWHQTWRSQWWGGIRSWQTLQSLTLLAVAVHSSPHPGYDSDDVLHHHHHSLLHHHLTCWFFIHFVAWLYNRNWCCLAIFLNNDHCDDHIKYNHLFHIQLLPDQIVCVEWNRFILRSVPPENTQGHTRPLKNRGFRGDLDISCGTNGRRCSKSC